MIPELVEGESAEIFVGGSVIGRSVEEARTEGLDFKIEVEGWATTTAQQWGLTAGSDGNSSFCLRGLQGKKNLKGPPE